jgi:prepilin-type N-terminal cleavage/methylation domain-containing protein
MLRLSSSIAGKTRRPLRRRRGAFTLIEVLMVVTALAIIAGVVVPQVTTVMDEARNAALLKDLREFTFAIERYCKTPTRMEMWEAGRNTLTALM